MIRDKLIKMLGGYTREELNKVGSRTFDDYTEVRRLGSAIPFGAEVLVTGDGIAGKFIVRQYDLEYKDNGGTIIKLNGES